MAKFIASNHLNEQQKQLFLETYFKTEIAQTSLARLNSLLIVYEFFEIAANYLWEKKKVWNAQAFK